MTVATKYHLGLSEEVLDCLAENSLAGQAVAAVAPVAEWVFVPQALVVQGVACR